MPRRRNRPLSAAVLAAVVLVLTACAGGSAQTEVTGQATATASDPTATAPTIMPDLVGMTVEDASADLAEFNVQISKDARIAAQKPGTVLEQDPVAGSRFQTKVTLVVSVAAPQVPDVTNSAFGDVEKQLTDLGFTVKEIPVFDESLIDGVITKQDPPPGAANAGTVTLTVARRPAVQFLSDLEDVSPGYVSADRGTQKSNGISYAHGILVDTFGSPGELEYDLSRQYRQLIGEVGLDDAADTGSVVKLEMYGDERRLADYTLIFGTTTPVDIDVTGILRLRLSISALEGRSQTVLGDLRLQGLPSEVGTSSTSTPTPG